MLDDFIRLVAALQNLDRTVVLVHLLLHRLQLQLLLLLLNQHLDDSRRCDRGALDALLLQPMRVKRCFGRIVEIVPFIGHFWRTYRVLIEKLSRFEQLVLWDTLEVVGLLDTSRFKERSFINLFLVLRQFEVRCLEQRLAAAVLTVLWTRTASNVTDGDLLVRCLGRR